ncbi:lipopolysaccharide kinase InaA family protein [Seonamhaeicola marinus]|uniref:Kdo domain containing protein n=1 Tax=Seonamhaeicola marinus TaxID=1912246 RepID=A0A5D0H6I9_9FLAO|nr:lipopolysaccharide kinase InaA family protein [Seonamhaeicola marinus]TYA65969.1 Kdo domain containing protein [Seonamhaeicola marinus]
MSKKYVFSKFATSSERLQIEDVIANFDEYDGGLGDRNIIKTIRLKDRGVNVKSFKIPNAINQIVYSFFRPSKARRSFEYANKLLEKGIGTPQPLAFFEFNSGVLFKQSFYVSESISYDFLYRNLIHDFDIPDYENILRAFTRFTYKMHENGIHFLDHSPGNTLIKKEGEFYKFYLVDLNRMEFRAMDFKTRVKNFSKLTKHKSMVKVMSDEYAKCTGENYDEIFGLMWKETKAFQDKYWKKERFKKRIKFWK